MSSSSRSSSSRKVQVHNKQQSLRATSKAKVASHHQNHNLPPSSSAAVPTQVSLGKRKEQDGTEQQQPQRKVVFKQVLGSPLTVHWPTLGAVDGQPILYTLLDMLALPALRPYLRQLQPTRSDPRQMSRGDKRRSRKVAVDARLETRSKTKAKEDAVSTPQDGEGSSTELKDSIPKSQPLVCGINSVTRHMELEIEASSARRRAADTATNVLTEKQGNATPSPSSIRLIFVCRNDLDPPKLAAHFPMMTCALNAVCHPPAPDSRQQEDQAALLIPLPAGSEFLLAKALGLRRCAALAIATDSLPGQTAETLLARIAGAGLRPLRASWLDTAADSALRTREKLFSAAAKSMLSTTVVENIPSTAPVNLNAVKLQKKHTRDEKKAWRKALRKDGYGVRRKKVLLDRRTRRHVRRRGLAERTRESEARSTAARDEAVQPKEHGARSKLNVAEVRGKAGPNPALP